MARNQKSVSGFPITIVDAFEIMGINDNWKPGQPTALLIHRTPFTWRFGIARRGHRGRDQWQFYILSRPSKFDYLYQGNWKIFAARALVEAIVNLYPDVTCEKIEEIEI